MEDQNQVPQFFPDKPQRPTLLTVLCILSFIWSGLSGSVLFTVYASYDELAPVLQELSSNFNGEAFELFARASKNYFLGGAVLNLFSFIGINLMWRMKKAGFHFYVGAQILILLLPVLYIQDSPLPVFDGLLSALFIFMYAKHYKLFT